MDFGITPEAPPRRKIIRFQAKKNYICGRCYENKFELVITDNKKPLEITIVCSNCQTISNDTLTLNKYPSIMLMNLRLRK